MASLMKSKLVEEKKTSFTQLQAYSSLSLQNKYLDLHKKKSEPEAGISPPKQACILILRVESNC